MKPSGRLLFLWISSLMVLASCGNLKIVDKPITFNEERKQLTLKYLKDRYEIIQETPKIDPKMVVLHWTAIPTFEKSFDAFKDVKLPGSRSEITSAGSLNVSTHFLVDQNGTVYRLLPENVMGRHVIGLNHCAIGIENVGGTKDKPLTKKQLKANIKLVKYLKEKYKIDYVIGHYEYTLFEGHELWLEKDAGYRTEKTDPGAEFMNSVRKAVQDLDFKPIPLKNTINE
ncbi:peptidoglycan recognition family protein [Ascidiimonas sp. W6]|uniref:peptidoglycan recognition protein family protein n=1 Tax=Ascidiimonas meishanensis TaxID=3128903 RepID=UPI0030EC1B51